MSPEELLHPQLLKTAREFGYKSFNQLQLKAFSVLKRGVHAIISAPTGYGKTEAALFPIISSLLEGGVEGGGIAALYITPLRALNRDVFNRMHELAAEVGVSLEVRHGDTPQSARRRIAESPPHILITTPETLQLVLIHEKTRWALGRVRWVVVDELHELISSKRGLQLTIALERLDRVCGNGAQRVGLSATLRNPLAAGYFLTGGRYFELVEVKGGRRYEVDVVFLGMGEDAEERVKRVAELIGGRKSVLIFVNTRNTAEALGARLKSFFGSLVAVHHGSLSKERRVEVEQALKRGELKCLVATSSLELGIDVGHVDYVLQYMSPRQVNRLVQRVGRSSHFVGGVARGSIVAADVDDLVEAVVIARRAERGDLEDLEYEERAYDVLAHQLVGLVLERGSVTIEEAHRLVTRALPFRELTLGELKGVAELLASIKLLRVEGNELKRGPRSLRYYYDAASTIPDVEAFDVVDLASRRRVGSLDGEFVVSSLAEGSEFVLGGRVWEVVKISIDDGKLFVKPSEGAEAAIPAWVGEDLPVPYKVAREVGALRRRLLVEPLEKLASEYGVDADLLKTVKDYVERQRAAVGAVPSDRVVLVECGNKVAVIHACLGTRANALLASLLNFYLARARGLPSRYFFDAYRVALLLPRDVSPEELADALANARARLLKHVRDAVRGSSAYLWKLLHVCQRMGVLERGSRPRIPAKKLAEVFSGTTLEEEVVKELLSTHFDLKTLEEFFERLEARRISLLKVRVRELSPMARSMFEKPHRAGLLTTGAEHLIVLEHVRRRLGRTRLALACLHCLNWCGEIAVDEAPDEVKCPRCGSRAVAVFNRCESSALEALKKWRRGAKLSEAEEDVVRSAQKSAILVMSYGKRALLCLAGRGVGPTVAARILSLEKSEEELLRAIVKAEVEYLRTREYWSRSPKGKV